MNNSLRKFLVVSAITFGFLGSMTSTVEANHSWGSYHWARTSNPFTLKLIDNVTPVWDVYLNKASDDWNTSRVLNTNIVGSNLKSKNCQAVSGEVRVCNSKYGNNGWLGIASIWATGSHIVQGTVRLNDTYFNTTKYNKPEWKQFVMCQEIGHTFGLDHQDELFDNANLGTCMDYTNTPLSNQTPNSHDFDELESIYNHLDASTTINQTISSRGSRVPLDTNDPSSWGKATRTSSDGNPSLYVRDLGNDEKIFTFVVWAN